MGKIRKFFYVIWSTDMPDNEEFHHGTVERTTVCCAIWVLILVLIVFGALFWFFAPRITAVLSVVIIVGLLLKSCFSRRDRRDAGVVTEQHHMNV